MPATILIVDDEPLNLALLTGLLGPSYRTRAARSGPSALAMVARERPDLILLDVMMPEMDGYEVLRRLQADPASAGIPVIFVTALGAEVDEEHGLALGAVDYNVKPVKPAPVLARVHTHLELKAARDRLIDANAWLEREVQRRMREALLAQELTLCTLAGMAEARDSDTGNHILRTQAYVETLARQLQADAAYADVLDDAQVARIAKGAPLHDIGKIAIRDHILLKPGTLTPEEFEVMKTHSRLGAEVIERAIAKASALHPAALQDGELPEALRDLHVARDIALHHHEKWDGSGYPLGLAGPAIPLAARLMAVADVFDALTMRRVYKTRWTREAAIAHILEGRGRHFDPGVVDAFAHCLPQFEALAQRFAD